MNEKYPLALPEGSVLAGQYIIERVLGQGGFGITYEAKDHKTGERVAVKEFFPDAMATRTNLTTVMAFSGEKGENYAYGKTCFLQEAETLAKFIGNENIVRIHSYFEENGTAYFVMDFIEGTSFDEYLKRSGGKIPYEDAARILIPVMDALSAVHSKGIVHRDVTPDNIYITNEGVVKLLDFGAARYSLGDQSRSLDIILKHGFAPKEQYTRRGKQGPYTDIYALGATFYFALTGKRPPDSVERLDEDDLVPPSSLGVQISGAAEDAILKALSVQPADRFQSMMEFKSALIDPRRAAAVGSQPAVAQTYFTAPDQSGVSPAVGGPAPATGQDDLQDLAATMKTAGKLAGRLAGKMAGRMAEKTAETAGVMAGTAGKMSEIMAAKKAETAEKLAAKMAEMEAKRAAQAAEKAARQEAERAAAEAARQEAERAAAEAARQEAERAAAEAARQEAARAAGAEESADAGGIGRTVGLGFGPAAESAAGDTVQSAVQSQPAKPAMNKKLLLVPAAAAVAAAILIGVFVFKPGESKKSIEPGNSGTSAVQPPAASQGNLPPSQPDISAPPDISVPAEPDYVLSGNWAVIGNCAENIMNGGIRVGDYFLEDGGHSIWDLTAKNYLTVQGNMIEDGVGTYSDMSIVDGVMYLLYDGIGGIYDIQKDVAEELPINDALGGRMQRLLLTEDFYVICCENDDGTSTVYRVIRANNELETCCTTTSAKGFTLSDDGWIYYVVAEEDGTQSVYRMRLDTLEADTSYLIHATNPNFELCNPIVAGDFLYLCDYNRVTLQSYNIVRINRETGYQSDDPVWSISSELDAGILADGIGFIVNRNNHIIYFCAYTAADDGSYLPNLYRVTGNDDGTFDMARISQNSYAPNLTYNSDGTYRLNYYHCEEDDSSYGNYYRNYDAEGTQITND